MCPTTGVLCGPSSYWELGDVHEEYEHILSGPPPSPPPPPNTIIQRFFLSSYLCRQCADRLPPLLPMSDNRLALELLLMIGQEMRDCSGRLSERDFNAFLQVNRALYSNLNPVLGQSAAGDASSCVRVFTHCPAAGAAGSDAGPFGHDHRGDVLGEVGDGGGAVGGASGVQQADDKLRLVGENSEDRVYSMSAGIAAMP
jgi:hypothetical protein